MRIVVMEIVAIVGGDERYAGLFRKPHEFAVDALLDL